MRRILTVVAVNIISIAAVLYVFELLFSPYLRLPRNSIERDETGAEVRFTWGHLLKNNQLGFREREFDIPKPPGVFRVMVLGDSFTWGAGLSTEERYTAVAERSLQAMLPERDIEILNFAITGGPTVVERDVLRSYKDVVEPDLIVVGYCLNDPQPRGQGYSVEREKLAKGLLYRTIYAVPDRLQQARLRFVGGLVSDAFDRLAEMFGLIPKWQTALQRTYETSSLEWREFVRALTEIKGMSDELGLPPPIFAVLNQGTYTDRPTDYASPDDNLKQFLRWYHQAESTAKTLGFRTYDHGTEIAAQLTQESLAVNVLDGHPSANLNRVYGDKLYRAILEVIHHSEDVSFP